MKPAYCLLLSKRRVESDDPGHESSWGRQKKHKILTKEVGKTALKLGENIYEVKFYYEN